MVNAEKLEILSDKLFFTTIDVANLFDYTLKSARVFCSRYVKKGLFIRLKKDLYITSFRWNSLTLEDFFKVSSFLRVPSYISLMTALSYYGITTQMYHGYFESITINSSKYYEVKNVVFKYYKINGKFFNNYSRKNGYFIATKEKAFLDSVYLYSFGKYRFDNSAIDYSKLDKDKVFSIARDFPKKTVKSLEKLWST